MSPTSRGRALVSYPYGDFGFSLSHFTFLMPATYLDDEYINMPETLCFSLDSHNIFSVELD